MNRWFPYIVLFAAFSLASSAAYYSVFGLSKLFASQATAVIILASTLEISKLITASYLHRYWSIISRLMKIYLTAAVVILMAITSLGIYGFLASSYQDTSYRLQNSELIISNVKTKRDRFQTQLDQISKEKQTVDANIEKLTNALSNNRIQYTDRNGNQVIKTDASNRKAYEKQLDIAVQRNQQLLQRETAMSDSVSAMDLKITNLQTTSTVAAEVGPLKYIAKVTNRSMDTVVNWLILMLILVFDPLAIILLISANKALLNTNNDDTEWDVTLMDGLEDEPYSNSNIDPEPITNIEPETPTPDNVIKKDKITIDPKTDILSYRNKFRIEREKKYKK
jgi:hypothetical protein